MYGVIAVMLGMMLWILGRFYSFRFLEHPMFLVSLLLPSVEVSSSDGFESNAMTLPM